MAYYNSLETKKDRLRINISGCELESIRKCWKNETQDNGRLLDKL